MDKDPQAADDQVQQVVQELHVHDHGDVATCEGSAVPDEARQEDHLVAQLENQGHHKEDSSGRDIRNCMKVHSLN